MVRREGKVSSTLHGRRTARGELGRRSLWMKLVTTSDGRTTAGFRHDGGVALDSGDGAVGTGEARQREAARTAATARSGRQRVVPTALLMRGSGTARGSHAATARC
jgi:hypothetical protein